MTLLPQHLEELNRMATSPEFLSSIVIPPVQPQETEVQQAADSETRLQQLARLGKAWFAHGVAEPLAGTLDLPAKLGIASVPLEAAPFVDEEIVTGLPQYAQEHPGMVTQQVMDWEKGLGLKGTPGEAVAGMIGGLLGYAAPYAGAAKLLGLAGRGLGALGAGRTLIQGYESLPALAQFVLREGARGAGTWALSEYPKPEEYRTPLGEFTGATVAGALGFRAAGKAFNLLGKLINKVRGIDVPHEEGAPGVQAQTEVKVPAAEQLPSVSSTAPGETAVTPAVGMPVASTASEAGSTVNPQFEIGQRVHLTDTVGNLVTAEPRRITDIQQKDGVPYYRVEGTNTYFPESRLEIPSDEAVSDKRPAAVARKSPLATLDDVQRNDLLVKADVLYDYWRSKAGAYVRTKEGVIAEEGSASAEKVARANKKLDKLNIIRTALQEGDVTEKQVRSLSNMWNSLMKTEAGRDVAEKLGYKPVEERARTVQEVPQPVEAPPEPTPPALTPETTRIVRRGKKGSVRVVFPDEGHALLFDVASSTRKAAEGKIPSEIHEQMLARVQHLLGIAGEENLGGAASRYRDAVIKLARSAEKGDVVNAPALAEITEPKVSRAAGKGVAKQGIKTGDIVTYGDAPFLVVDASDSVRLKLRNQAGDEFYLPRKMVKRLPVGSEAADRARRAVKPKAEAEGPVQKVAELTAKLKAAAQDALDRLSRAGTPEGKTEALQAIKEVKAVLRELSRSGAPAVAKKAAAALGALRGKKNSAELRQIMKTLSSGKLVLKPGRAGKATPKSAEARPQAPLESGVPKETEARLPETAVAEPTAAEAVAGTKRATAEDLMYELETVADEIQNKIDDITGLKDKLKDTAPEDRADINAALTEAKDEFKQLVADAAKTLAELARSDDADLAMRASSALEKLRSKKLSPQRVSKVLGDVLSKPEKTLPALEGVVPGTEAWNRTVRENPHLKDELQAKETAFWNDVVSRLAASGEKTVYVDEIRKLPEVAEKGVSVSAVAKQLRARGFTVGDPVDRVLDSLKVTEGSHVDIETLRDVPEVKNGEIALAILQKEAERRGATVIDKEHIVELNCGIPVDAIARKIKIALSKNTKPTFTPIQDVSSARGSLPRRVMELLPDSLQGALKGLDEQIALVNSRIKRRIIIEGSPVEMEAGAKEKYYRLVKELDSLDQKREQLRGAVEKSVGELSKREYSQAIFSKLTKNAVLDRTAPIFDEKGGFTGWKWTSPLTGQELFLERPVKATKMDEKIWKRRLNWYSLRFGVMRDILGEPIVRPLRNAFRVVQVSEKEYQTWLYEILKPIIRDTDALNRVTFILEGKDVRKATALEKEVADKLRKWYDSLFKEFFGAENASRYLTKYAPWVREAGGRLADVYRNLGRPGDLTPFFMFERETNVPLFPVETNALVAALKYLRSGLRYKYLEPAFREVDQYTQRITVDKFGKARLSPAKTGTAIMHEDRVKFLEEFKNSLLRRPFWEERLTEGMVESVVEALGRELGPDKSSVAREFSAFVTHAIYLNTIGYNPASVFKQLTQQVLSIGALTGNPITGLKYWGKAAAMLATKEGRETVKQYCWVLQNRVYQEGLEQQTKAFSRIMRPIEKAGFFAFEKADGANVAISFLMKLLHAQRVEKLPFAEAVDAANAFAGNTQFLYGPTDSPMFYKTSAGRLFGVLSSYPVNFLRLMYKTAQSGPTGEFGAKGLAKVAATCVLLYASAFGLGKLTGLDFSSTTPLDTAKGWFPLSLVVGGSSTASIPINVMRDASNTLSAYLKRMPLDAEQSVRSLKKDLLTLVPFPMVELRRVLKALEAATNNGKVYDERGKLMYTMSPSEIVRSVLGATVESKERRVSHTEIERAKQEMIYLRQHAVDAYLNGDRATFSKLQNMLIQRGYTPIRNRDIVQAQKLRSTTAIERHRKGLPKTFSYAE